MPKTMRDMIVGAGFAAVVLAPLPVFAADAAGEITTAATHAKLASEAATLGGVRTHLHHTLNCIVGPSDARFDAKQLNPCAGAGSGAIPDTSDAGKKKALEAAATTAGTGLVASDLAKAQKAASDTAAQLRAIK